MALRYWPYPPAGSYDPALDAQEAAAQRGYFDLSQDTGKADERALADYGVARAQGEQQRTWGLQDFDTQRADVERGYGRNRDDLEQQRTYGTEDYNRNIGLLQRSYRIQQAHQAQGARAQLIRGGTLLAANRVRARNEARDREPLDTGQQRLLTGVNTALGRLSEDRGLSLQGIDRSRDRFNTTTDWGLDALRRDTDRGFEDRSTGLTRAGRELSAFGLDTTAARAFQAAGAGWTPPVPPPPPAPEARKPKRRR